MVATCTGGGSPAKRAGCMHCPATGSGVSHIPGQSLTRLQKCSGGMGKGNKVIKVESQKPSSAEVLRRPEEMTGEALIPDRSHRPTREEGKGQGWKRGDAPLAPSGSWTPRHGGGTCSPNLALTPCHKIVTSNSCAKQSCFFPAVPPPLFMEEPVGFTNPPANRGVYRSAKSFPGPTSCKTQQWLILLIKPGAEPHARTMCHVPIHRAQCHGQRDSDAPRHHARHGGDSDAPLALCQMGGGEGVGCPLWHHAGC